MNIAGIMLSPLRWEVNSFSWALVPYSTGNEELLQFGFHGNVLIAGASDVCRRGSYISKLKEELELC